MNAKYIPEELISKYNKGTCTDEERAIVESWHLKDLDESTFSPSADSILKTNARMRLKVLEHAASNQPGRVLLWPRIAVAASIVLAVTIGGYLYLNNQRSKLRQGLTYASDIAPGKQGATLTLASGKKIRLSDAGNGQLAQEAGVVITKSADGQLVYEVKGSASESEKVNTLTTAKGETYQVHLPDGSLVYLNAASSLTYSAASIEHGKRLVKLQGEGYFEVAKDKKHPFVVQTDQQEVTVLGTHFNINSYADEGGTRTTLLEGSVKVSSSQGAELILKPNQQSVLTAAARIDVRNVNATDVIDWKNGEFVFNDETLESVMRKVSRWYDVDIIYDDETLKLGTFGGSVSRFSNVSELLKMLEVPGNVKFKIEGRKIIVSKY